MIVKRISLIIANLIAVVLYTGCAEKNYYAQVPPEFSSNVQSLKVALVSPYIKCGDIESNLKHFEDLIRRAKRQKAQLVCFPEYSLTGYFNCLVLAQQIPGPITERLSEIAAKYNVYISMGMPEKYGQIYYVCQALIGPKGYIGKYRKHFPTENEVANGFSPGKEFPVFDIEGFTLGINICADGRFKETVEALRSSNVDIIHHPHLNGHGLGVNAEIWTRGKMSYFVERAVYARAYILINNLAEKSGALGFGSGALVIDPMGQVIARTMQRDNTEKILYAVVHKPIDVIIPQFERGRIHKHLCD